MEARHRNPEELLWDSTGVEVLRKSVKMGGCMMALANRTIIGAMAEIYERRSDVLWYVHQPFKRAAHLVDERGVTQARFEHHPAFMLGLERAPVIIDAKSEAYLVDQASKGRVYKDARYPFAWHYPEMERFYSSMGLEYELHSTAEIPHIWILNQQHLDRYRSAWDSGLTDEDRKSLTDLFAVIPVIPMGVVQDRFGISVDTVNRGIVEGILHADLLHFSLNGTPAPEIVADERYLPIAQLRVPERSILPMPTREGVSPGLVFDLNGEALVVLRVNSERDEVLVHGAGHIQKVLPLAVVQYALKSANNAWRPSEESYLADRAMLAKYNLSIISQAVENRDKLLRDDPSVPERTMRDWKKKYFGASDVISGLLALIGRPDLRGNRTPRISTANEKLIKKYVRIRYENTASTTMRHAHKDYADECHRIHDEIVKQSLSSDERDRRDPEAPISYEAFTVRCKKYVDWERKLGIRAAYGLEAVGTQWHHDMPPHGSREFEVVHIDDTPYDAMTIDNEGNPLKRPNICVAYDASKPAVGAMWVGYCDPQTFGVLMVLRDFVRRHGRVPEWVVFDNASYMQTDEIIEFAKVYNVKLLYRGETRDGSPIESSNRAREVEHDMRQDGSTSHLKNAKQFAAMTLPAFRANQTLAEVYEGLERYFFGEVPSRPHLYTGQTGPEREAALRKKNGSTFMPVKFDADLMIYTSPYVARRKRRISTTDGVRVNYRQYSCPVFANCGPHAVEEVREELFNANLVYVQVDGRYHYAFHDDLRASPSEMTTWEDEQSERERRRRAGQVRRAALKLGLRPDVREYQLSEFEKRKAAACARAMLELYSSIGMVCPFLWEAVRNGQMGATIPPVDIVDAGSAGMERSTSSSGVQSTPSWAVSAFSADDWGDEVA